MALRFTGPEGTFYAKVTVGKNYQRTLEPIPGELYEIDDPGDGNWAAAGTEKAVKADKGPVAPDTTKNAENASTEAPEGI